MIKNLSRIVGRIAHKGARPFTVTLYTIPRLRAACPFVGVRKLQVLNGILGFNYQRSVNRQRKREHKRASFRTERNWFNHIAAARAIVTHGRTRYLQLKVQRVLHTLYVDQHGHAIAQADIKPYLDKRSAPAKQRLVRPVLTIVPAFDSILSLTVDGRTYGAKINY